MKMHVEKENKLAERGSGRADDKRERGNGISKAMNGDGNRMYCMDA